MTAGEEEGLPSPSGELAAEVRRALERVMDPEMGASIVDLNMVRRVEVMGDVAQVDLVLTTPGCPLAYWLAEQARQAAQSVAGISQAVVRVLDEPWQPPGWEEWLAQTLGDRN